MAQVTSGKHKKLLNKTLKIFTLYALLVLAASVPVYYYLVDGIWLEELDEHNEIIADKTEHELKETKIDETTFETNIAIWNKIQPGINLTPLEHNTTINKDSNYTALRRNQYVQNNELKRFRGLARKIDINGKPYLLTVETNVEETEETAIVIAIATFFFFVLLVVGFLFLNRYLSNTLWKPFRDTLAKLKSFDLNRQETLHFEQSGIIEFEEMNTVLAKLIDQNISVYKSQKEFTENASHELQTPLAIIRNKVDTLLQKENVTDSQYEIIEDINKAITRIARINKNLLLLTKIDNNQFNESRIVNISLLVYEILEVLKEYADTKEITWESNIDLHVEISGNKTLIEVLLNNILLNAIRHSPEKSKMNIALNSNKLTVSNYGAHPLNKQETFKRFAITSGDTSGSGLGLSIIYEICKKHQWKADYNFENNMHVFTVNF